MANRGGSGRGKGSKPVEEPTGYTDSDVCGSDSDSRTDSENPPHWLRKATANMNQWQRKEVLKKRKAEKKVAKKSKKKQAKDAAKKDKKKKIKLKPTAKPASKNPKEAAEQRSSSEESYQGSRKTSNLTPSWSQSSRSNLKTPA